MNLGIDQRRITWGRVVDLGDRALRKVNVNLGGISNGFPREDKFDITVASEIMAIFCLLLVLKISKKELVISLLLIKEISLLYMQEM